MTQELTEVEKRAWELMGMLDRLRKRYPEARAWTKEVSEGTKYIVTGKKADWIRSYLKEDKSR